jgi:hypothetical protein
MSNVSFSRVTPQQVIGVLKATNSADPDVLFAAKQTLLEPVKPLKFFGIWAYVTGGLATLLIVFAFIGIPLLFFGWWVRRRATQNIETIEAAYAEYVSSLGAQASVAV